MPYQTAPGSRPRSWTILHGGRALGRHCERRVQERGVHRSGVEQLVEVTPQLVHGLQGVDAHGLEPLSPVHGLRLLHGRGVVLSVF